MKVKLKKAWGRPDATKTKVCKGSAAATAARRDLPFRYQELEPKGSTMEAVDRRLTLSDSCFRGAADTLLARNGR